MSSTVICPSLARNAKRLISASTPRNVNNSAFLTTGTINPFGPETAIEISAKSKATLWSPSIIEFTSGNNCNALVTAFVKNDI